MMTGVKSWLLGVILTAFAAGLAQQIAPKGKEAAMVRLVGGLLLVLAILRPLGSIDWEELSLPAGNFSVQSESAAADYREKQQEELSAIIAEKTAAYIWDKASALGGDYRITVSVSAGESGVPLPRCVTIAGPYRQELATWIESELGLGAAEQNWLEEGEWNTRNANKSN